MKVASDLDHVMCNLAGQARVVLAADLGVPVDEIIETQIYHSSFAHADPDIHARIRVDHAFWERAEVMRDALPMPGAVEAAWKLFDAGLLTSYVTRRAPGTSVHTQHWLARWRFPPVTTHYVGNADPRTTYASCKSEACMRSGADILIDDSQDEIVRVVDAGLTGILVDAPIGREARRAFCATRPDIPVLPSIVEAVDHLVATRAAS